MSCIHFFPGMAVQNLIHKQHLSLEIIKNAFQCIANKDGGKQSSYQYFKNIYVYITESDLPNSQFNESDIILAGSIGGVLANHYIKLHHIKNPRIVAFESLGLNQLDHVWHFITSHGQKYISKNHIEFLWNDAGIGHNAYMLHPHKDKLIKKSEKPLKIGELEALKGDHEKGYFYLYDTIDFINTDTGNQKTVNNVLMRCDSAGELIISENSFDQVSIMLDVLVFSAHARAFENIDLMPIGFSVKKLE